MDLPQLGVLFRERYELKRELGRGSMGAVWLARDQALNRRGEFIPEWALSAWMMKRSFKAREGRGP